MRLPQDLNLQPYTEKIKFLPMTWSNIINNPFQFLPPKNTQNQIICNQPLVDMVIGQSSPIAKGLELNL